MSNAAKLWLLLAIFIAVLALMIGLTEHYLHRKQTERLPGQRWDSERGEWVDGE